MLKFPYIPQLDSMTCGPACIAMIAKHYGRSYSLEKLLKYSNIAKQGIIQIEQT